MNLWQQNYDPAGNIWLSSLIASLPILFFFFALIKLKLKGYVAASWTVVIALTVALLFYKMPVDHALASVVYGFFYGLWPIAWIIIAAVFVYKISVKTGQFDIIRSSILSITPDQRLQMLIVGFSFGAFLEGAAGFGAPVAITAALLVGLGFNPLYAAGLCLIVNTAPVAFGAMGIPILVAGQVTGLDSFEIGQMVGRQLPFLTIIVLFWIMAIMDGWRGVKETWPAVMVAGGSFAIAQYLSSNFIGPELPDIISSLVSLVCLTLFLKRWQPVRIFRFGDMGASQVDQTLARTHYTAGQVVRAWSPFLFLTATVTLWSVPPFKALFAPGGAMYHWVVNIPVPYLDKLVARMPPVVHEATAYAAVYKFDWFSATGTAILFAALLSIVWLKMKPSAALSDFWQHAERSGITYLLHRNGAGIRVYLKLLRAFINPGVGPGTHRQRVYLLLTVPRLAGGISDRVRHLIKRTVCRPAGYGCSANRRFGCADGCGKYHRRRDRQDDLAAIYRYRLCGEWD